MNLAGWAELGGEEARGQGIRRHGEQRRCKQTGHHGQGRANHPRYYDMAADGRRGASIGGCG